MGNEISSWWSLFHCIYLLTCVYTHMCHSLCVAEESAYSHHSTGPGEGVMAQLTCWTSQGRKSLLNNLPRCFQSWFSDDTHCNSNDKKIHYLQNAIRIFSSIKRPPCQLGQLLKKIYAVNVSLVERKSCMAFHPCFLIQVMWWGAESSEADTHSRSEGPAVWCR